MAGGRRIWTLIPAAGESERFRAEGIVTPKPLLRVRDRHGTEASMLAHVLAQLPLYTTPMVALPLGARLPNDIDRPCAMLQIEKTRGQTDTIRQMLDAIRDDCAVLTMDCDTIVRYHDLLFMTVSTHDVEVAVAECHGTDMARVEPVTMQFQEQPSMARYGVVSARMFRRKEALEAAIAPTFSETINRVTGSKAVRVVEDWQDWGTPEKLRAAGAEIIE